MASQAPAAVILRATQGLLAVGALALGARAVAWVALPGEHPPEAILGDVQRVAEAKIVAAHFEVIGERDLFRRKVEEPVAPEPPPAVETTLNVELLGTLVLGNERPAAVRDEGNDRKTPSKPREPKRESVAILRDVDGKVRTLVRGDVFADERAKLIAIERGRIVLEHGERLETVTLEESALAAKTGPPRPTYSAPRDPAAKAAAAKAEEIARLQREVQRRMREAMPQAAAASATGTN
jgi:type II secretory pathway component PulC